MNSPQIFTVWRSMPETVGRSLEEIERTYYATTLESEGGH